MIQPVTSPIETLSRDGFAVVPDIVDLEMVEALVDAVGEAGPLDALPAGVA